MQNSAKMTWGVIIGIVAGLIVGFLIWGSSQLAEGQATLCSIDEFKTNITLCTDLARISEPGAANVDACIDQVLDTCGFGGKPDSGR